jgi:hypothetical protein
MTPLSPEVRQFLDDQLPGRWIGRVGPIPWPPRLPYLKPQDFSFWGYAKENVYIPPLPRTINQLKEHISETVASVNGDNVTWKLARV